MQRFFVTPDQVGENKIRIQGSDVNHMKNVLRMRPGEEVMVSDGNNRQYRCRVEDYPEGEAVLAILEAGLVDTELPSRIYLFQGLPKQEKMELIVQKAVELGVQKIGVFSSRYCSAYVNQNKLQRFARVAREAAKQCLRSSAPTVEYFSDLPAALASARDYKNKLFACEFSGVNDLSLGGLRGSTAVVIGSEGGFSQEEFELAKNEYGFASLTLGRRILRAETAAICALSVVMFCLGELE